MVRCTPLPRGPQSASPTPGSAPKLDRASYSFLARLLHRLALGSDVVAGASFEVERLIFGRELKIRSDAEHVFVVGLARAGTTLLMRLLFETGQFCSLTYRDMPFVLAPNLWNAASAGSRRTMAPTGRAHGDGILVDFDSPEALDEVFWRVFSGNRYIAGDRLRRMRADDETIENFRLYVELIMRRYKSDRYLSKNNNNILRIDDLLRSFPRATIFVPFRSPVQQAHSLLDQHRRFVANQKRDPFTLRYMTWLVHHEFGADHRPFDLEIETSGTGGDAERIDYWLMQWIAAYRYLLREIRSNPNSLIPISYERLCGDTERVWGAVCRRTKIRAEPIGGKIADRTGEIVHDAHPGNVEASCEIYDGMTELSNAWLSS